MPLLVTGFIFLACNNAGKDSVEKADSANTANADTALNRNEVVIDENSSSFLVRVANGGMAEVEMTMQAEQKAVYEDVRSFAAMLHRDHSGVNETVRSLAVQKKITLPATISAEKQKEIDHLKKNTGKNLDREFIKTMIKNHEAGITMFQQAMQDAKDAEVRSFADKTRPTLRAHLDSAKALQKKYW